jgi:hypothetical protein
MTGVRKARRRYVVREDSSTDQIGVVEWPDTGEQELRLPLPVNLDGNDKLRVCVWAICALRWVLREEGASDEVVAALEAGLWAVKGLPVC